MSGGRPDVNVSSASSCSSLTAIGSYRAAPYRGEGAVHAREVPKRHPHPLAAHVQQDALLSELLMRLDARSHVYSARAARAARLAAVLGEIETAPFLVINCSSAARTKQPHMSFLTKVPTNFALLLAQIV